MARGAIGAALDAISPNDRRNRLTDILGNYAFHVFDVSFSIPTVFTPVFGFKSVTAPELVINEKPIKEGTFEYPRSVVQSADVSEVVLERGVRFFDSDFYDWAHIS